jgi:hypothetical protein
MTVLESRNSFSNNSFNKGEPEGTIVLKHRNMKLHRGRGSKALHILWGEQSAPHSRCFIPDERGRAWYQLNRRLCPRVSLNMAMKERIPDSARNQPGCPGHSQSLYLLTYHSLIYSYSCNTTGILLQLLYNYISNSYILQTLGNMVMNLQVPMKAREILNIMDLSESTMCRRSSTTIYFSNAQNRALWPCTVRADQYKLDRN